MKFTLDQPGRVNVVASHRRGELRIGERVVVSSAIVTADRLLEDWPVGDVATLSPERLEDVLSLDPEIVILGTGERQVFPEPSLFAAVAGRGVGLEVMDNGAACRTYNVLLAEGRRVALAIIL